MTTDVVPKALILAALLASGKQLSFIHHADAAAELRRLHALNHELLEALSGLVGCIDHGSQNPTQKLEVARTAIAKATGETK